MGGFSDFFRTIFGRDVDTETRARPQGYQQQLDITMEEAYRGTTRLIQNNGNQKQVRIPPGVRTGSKVRVAGAGPNGVDLYLIVNVSEDNRFERRGSQSSFPIRRCAFAAYVQSAEPAGAGSLARQ